MTIEQVNKIFKTKYPEGEVVQKGKMGGASKSSTSVIFSKGGKVYSYNVDNYVSLLKRLGFNVIYRHTVDSYKDRIVDIEKILADCGEESIFEDEGWLALTDDDIQSYNNELEQINNILNTSVVVNG
jgi:hypothetical protein